MAIIVSSIDPSHQTSGSFSCGLVNGGWLFVHNESAYAVLFDLGVNRGSVLASSNTVRCISVGLSTDIIKYTVISQAIQPTNAPVNRVYAEAYQPSEWSGGEQYWPLSSPILQQRNVSLPMMNISKQANRITLASDTQVTPLAAQKLLNGASAGSAGTNGFASIFSVEAQPVTVGQCTLALGVMILDGGGAITNVITPFGYYDISRAGQFGPTQGVYESFVTPRYVTTSYASGDSSVVIYYYLFDGYGGMTIDLSVNWSLMNASTFGLTSIVPPSAYGQFSGFNITPF